MEATIDAEGIVTMKTGTRTPEYGIFVWRSQKRILGFLRKMQCGFSSAKWKTTSSNYGWKKRGQICKETQMVIEELTKELLKYKNKLNHVNGNFKLMKEINENL